MKKTSIIAIAIVYLVAIILVGFFGIRMKVYDPVIYVEKIAWNASEYENNKLFSVSKYTLEEKENNGYLYDASIKYVSYDEVKNLALNFKFSCDPSNATNTKLTYSINTENDKVKIEVKGDNTVDVIFNMGTSVMLTAKSTDGKEASYTVNIDVVDFSMFG